MGCYSRSHPFSCSDSRSVDGWAALCRRFDGPYRPKETGVRPTLAWPTDPSHDFIGRHRAAKTLQHQFANENEFGQRLNSAEDPLADQNWRDLASSHNRAAWFDTVPMTA